MSTPMDELNPDALIREARTKSGLDDFGADDFREGLDRLTDSLARETVFTADGLAAVHARLLRLLVNRLRFEDARKRHPEIAAEEILPPVVISSLPRCGSTKLHRLLAEGGDYQLLPFWLMYNLAPFPDVPDDRAARIADAEAYIGWRYAKSPQMKAGHLIEALEPEEESYLIELTFAPMNFAAHYEIPSFLDWLRGRDRVPIYAYLKETLRYVQWQHYRQAKRPFLLKAPPNIGFEPEIAAVFPGTRFVMLHRDPVEAISSLAKMVWESRRMHAPEPQAFDLVFEWALEEFASGMDRQMAWRDANPDAPILDVAYRDICDRDMAVVQDVYAFLGKTLSPDGEAGMRAWLAANVQHKYGRHHYSTDSDDPYVVRIRERFSGYISRFESLF